MMDGRAQRAIGVVSPHQDLASMVGDVLAATPFIDVHTHLFSPEFGPLGLWGIDDLLTYHYLEAEFFRFSAVRPHEYWSLSKPKQADLIWKTLFVENVPLSEATRGVVAVLDALGLDTASETLRPLREFFREQKPADYVPWVFRLAGISAVVMTNDPLDPAEAAQWIANIEPDPQFHSALRLDRLLNEFAAHCETIAAQRYSV
ncbi:MAG TPA: glucuronate isomerase, partial [Bryobacteraceae bacterium]|nr:glucuronate isomerase [Bryobacteraceae bacterium]